MFKYMIYNRMEEFNINQLNNLNQISEQMYLNLESISKELEQIKSLPISWQQKHKEFGFDSISDFVNIKEIIMLMKRIEWVRETEFRGMEQTEFRNVLITRDKKCVVSKKHIAKECQACHIIPHSEGGDYSVNNGLLIANTFHKMFDDFFWSINPSDYTIDILCDDEEVVGSIYEYSGKKINVEPNPSMTRNLNWHWTRYLSHKNLFVAS